MPNRKLFESVFPPVSEATPDGLLALGGKLSATYLLSAYTHGIFPWPLDSETLAWFAPPRRGVLMLDEFHAPRTLRKLAKTLGWHVTINSRFPEIVQQCANVTNRHDGNSTWITKGIIKGFCELHRLGFAYSVETSDSEGSLVGGLYGVSINGYIGGESMFYLQPGASKFALVTLVSMLKQAGVPWLDCQMVTGVLAQFGARYIDRSLFTTLLNQQLTQEPVRFPVNARFNVNELF